MSFLVDANLPPDVASWLRGFGYEAVHVMDVASLGQDDRAIFDHARLHDLIIVPKEERFRIADDPFLRSPQGGLASSGQCHQPCVAGLAGSVAARNRAASGCGRQDPSTQRPFTWRVVQFSPWVYRHEETLLLPLLATLAKSDSAFKELVREILALAPSLAETVKDLGLGALEQHPQG